MIEGLGFFYLLSARRTWEAGRSKTMSQVAVVGGVPIPQRQGRIIALFVVMIFGSASGVPAFWFMGHHIFSILLVGSTLLLIAGFIPVYRRRDFILFDPDGILVAQSWLRYKISWTEIESVSASPMHGNPVVHLWFRDPETVAKTAEGRPGAPEKLMKQFAAGRKWQGSDTIIMTSNFGLDAILLAKVIERYASDSSARKTLQSSTPLDTVKPSLVTIEKTRFNDVQPGEFEYRGYHYTLIFPSWTLKARVYDDTPTEISFFMSGPQEDNPSFREAVRYVQNELHITKITYLDL